jgi:hypothetical protein
MNTHTSYISKSKAARMLTDRKIKHKMTGGALYASYSFFTQSIAADGFL